MASSKVNAVPQVLKHTSSAGAGTGLRAGVANLAALCNVVLLPAGKGGRPWLGYLILARPGARIGLAKRDEAFLVERVRDGDLEAFEELVQPFEGRVYQTALRILRHPEDAADVYQEATLSAFEKIDSFSGASSFGTWLHSIVVNCALMRVRSAARNPVISEGDLPSFNWLGMHKQPVSRWADSPDVQAERTQLRGMLSDALDELPEADRAVVWLKDVEGLNHAEIAAATGLTVSATRSRLHRARLFLRGRFERLLGGAR